MTDQQIYSLSSRNSKGWVEDRAKKEYRDVRGEINGDVVQWRFGPQRCSVQDVWFKMFGSRCLVQDVHHGCNFSFLLFEKDRIDTVRA